MDVHVEQEDLDAVEEVVGYPGQYSCTITKIIATPMAIILQTITQVQAVHGHTRITELMPPKLMKSRKQQIQGVGAGI